MVWREGGTRCWEGGVGYLMLWYIMFPLLPLAPNPLFFFSLGHHGSQPFRYQVFFVHTTQLPASKLAS